MEQIGGKWKLPILWHLAEDGRSLMPILKKLYCWEAKRMREAG